MIAVVTVCNFNIAQANTTTTTTNSTASCAVCPFCSAIALTFAQQLDNSDIVVVAKLIKVPSSLPLPSGEFPKAEFEIQSILKGKKFVGDGMKFKTQLVGLYPEGQKFLVMGVDPPKVAWTTPMKASDRVFKYLDEIQKLPEKGPERLAFFQNYFEDKESVLAFDAYDEFAAAKYEDLIALKDKMDHKKLVGWVKSKDTSVNRRRLYFTMLGVCGKKEDIEMLEDFITSGSRKKRAGLDALIACYLNLKGEEGIELIQKTFIEDKDADYVDTLAAVSALRFHGTEVDIVPKKKIVKAIRHLLDRPKMADMIIPDLARWEDWSVMERLVTMFKDADPESNWLRVPVITYLRACPLPEADTYIAELQKIDPEAVKRADFFLGFDDDDDWGDEDEDDSEEEPPTEEDAETSKKTVPATDDDSEKDTSDNQDKHVVHKIPVDAASNQISDGDQAQGTVATQEDAESADPEELQQTQTMAPELAAFVSTNSESMANQVTARAPTIAPTPTPVPAPVQPPAATVTSDLTLSIIFIPMAVSLGIFLLLWSVVNGWFERLIF